MKAQFVIRATKGKAKRHDPAALQFEKCFPGEIECPDGCPSLPEYVVSVFARIAEDHPEIHECDKLEITIGRLP